MAAGAAPQGAAPGTAEAGPGLGAKAVLRRLATLTALAGVTALAGLASAAAPPARPLGCLIEPDRVADIGSQVVGLVERIDVERGDRVRRDQPLLRLRDGVERANVDVAATRERIDADVLASRAALDLATQKVRRAEALVAQNFVSEQALELARGEHEMAAQKLSQSRSQQKVWAQERRLAEAQLALRTVRSPFAGVVTERFVNVGERVEDRPLLRIAVIDPLRVELMVPTAQYGQIRPGAQLTIRPELPGAAPVLATVSHVDRVLDAASNSFRVRLTLPNPGHRLPAGLRCKADLPGAAPAPAAPVSPAQALPDATRPTAQLRLGS